MSSFLVQTSAKILIADDSSSVRAILKKILETHGRTWKVCAEAADGLQAVQLAVTSRPDLVILDVQMPVLDGLAAAKRISKSFPSIPILIYTIHKSAYVDAEAKSAGAFQVIAKGDAVALLSAVEGLLTGNSTLFPSA